MYQNPYAYMGAQAPMNPYPVTAPTQQVTKVNGENGANAYSMGPNSSAILLDTSGTMIWAVTTDGAGYKTVVPYDITPHKSQAAITYEGLENRIKRLEEMIDGYFEANQRGRHESKSNDGED